MIIRRIQQIVWPVWIDSAKIVHLSHFPANAVKYLKLAITVYDSINDLLYLVHGRLLLHYFYSIHYSKHAALQTLVPTDRFPNVFIYYIHRYRC